MNLEKLSVKTIQFIKQQSMLIAFLIVVTLALGSGGHLLNKKVIELKEANNTYNQALSELESLNMSIASSETLIKDSSGAIAKTFMTREEFVKFIGAACTETGCEIMQLQGGDVVTDSSINKINFKFEVRGDVLQIYKFMQRIDALNTRYAMTSATLRKQDEFAWLDRYQLDAFTLDWWNLKDDATGTSTDSAERQVSLDDIFGSRKMSLYLNIDFITADSLS
ncbi:MAG: hypothetical protein RSC68_00290 [Acinetobacter sp.]